MSLKLLALPMVIKPEVKWLRWSSQLRKRGENNKPCRTPQRRKAAESIRSGLIS